MSGARAFLRGLVAAAILGSAAPLGLLLVGPVFGGRTVLWMMLAAAAAVALARSVANGRTQPGRSLLLEVVFVACGLAFALCLAAPGLAGAALALWGFGLVLSLRALLPDGASAPVMGPDDPFDEARARALALLEEEP